MCGIIGLNWEDEAAVKRGIKIIEHRGPDDKGHIVYGVSLGMTRLSIQDTSSKGHQPMSRKGRTIVFNGEIFNFKDIKKDLKGYRHTSGSDTEVILHAYDKWGKRCLSKFNGHFAFCIYNPKKKEFFIARDRFGIKPLYYTNRGKKFAFCSEIKGILEHVKKEVDPIGLKQFFTFRFTMGERTLVKGVKRFLPGYYMIVDARNGKVKEYKPYYTLPKQLVEDESLEYYADKVKETLEKSVERRMVSDVPVACLLSGGLDSTIITTLAKKHNDKLNTFSIGFDASDELPYARMVAKKIKTKHREFRLDKDNILKYLDKMIWHMDEPIGDPGYLPILVLSKNVKKYNKVVLSGDGADEILTGYDRYKFLHYGLLLRQFAVADLGNDILKRLKKMRGKDDYDAFLEIIRLFDDEELARLEVEPFDARKIWKNKYDDAVTNAQEFDINTVLACDLFMKADKMSSAYGLEQRVPFMDHELVELAFSIPLKHKLKLWNEKYVLKEAFKDDIPEEILKRKKHAFHVPIDYWFKNVLGVKLRGLLNRSNHDLYDKSYIYDLLLQLKSKGDNYKQNWFIAQKLWSILVFEMWYERFMK